MEALFAVTLGLLAASGIYLLLRGRTFAVVLGLTLLSYAVNLFLFAMGRLRGDAAVLGLTRRLRAQGIHVMSKWPPALAE